MPRCKYCGKEFSSNVIGFHEKWCKDQKEKKEQETKKPAGNNITEMNAEPAIELIEKCQDIEQMMTWLADESQGKNRKTVNEALEAKMKELEGGQEPEGDAGNNTPPKDRKPDDKGKGEGDQASDNPEGDK